MNIDISVASQASKEVQRKVYLFIYLTHITGYMTYIRKYLTKARFPIGRQSISTDARAAVAPRGVPTDLITVRWYVQLEVQWNWQDDRTGLYITARGRWR